jgi:predicted small metal-binding protein
MGSSYACADLGVECPGSFTTETEPELWRHIELHVEQAHTGFALTPEAKDQVQAAIKTAA